MDLVPQLVEEQMGSTESPDIVQEGPTEEPKIPAAVWNLYDSSTSAAHSAMPSPTRSGKSGEGGGDSGSNETVGAGKNAGNVAAELYSGRTSSYLLGAENVEAGQTSIEFRKTDHVSAR